MEENDAYRTEKDISDSWRERINESLNTIKELYYTILVFPEKIVYVNLELHSVFKSIYPRLKKRRLLNEIIRQFGYEKRIRSMCPIKIEKVMDRESEEIANRTTKQKCYNEYRNLIEKREMHLNYCLEILGFWGTDYKITRRLR